MVLINRKYISVEFSSAKLRQRNRSLSVLLDINNFLSSSLRLDEVLTGALSTAMAGATEGRYGGCLSTCPFPRIWKRQKIGP
jgi:nitrate/nitrite-specific signal transduction histidine kinase